MGANLPTGSVHRFTNNVLTNKYGSDSSNNPPSQGCVCYGYSYTIQAGSLVHFSGNTFSAVHGNTYLVYISSTGGQVIHDNLNKCATVGNVRIQTTADAPAHTILINNFTSLTSLSILHATNVNMTGQSIRITNSVVNTCDLNTGAATDLEILVNMTQCKSAFTLFMGDKSKGSLITIQTLSASSLSIGMGKDLSDSLVRAFDSNISVITLSGTITNNSSILVRGIITAAVTMAMVSNCISAGPCRIDIRSNTIVSSTSALLISGSISDYTTLIIFGNNISSTGSVSPLYFSKVDAVRGGGGMSLAKNTITSRSGFMAMACANILTFTGPLEIWRNTFVTGGVNLKLGATPSNVNFIGNNAPSFTLTGSNPSVGGGRVMACNKAVNADWSTPSIGFVSLPCDDSSTVSRCENTFNQPVTDNDLALCAADYFRLLTDAVPLRTVPHWAEPTLVEVDSRCAVSTTAPMKSISRSPSISSSAKRSKSLTYSASKSTYRSESPGFKSLTLLLSFAAWKSDTDTLSADQSTSGSPSKTNIPNSSKRKRLLSMTYSALESTKSAKGTRSKSIMYSASRSDNCKEEILCAGLSILSQPTASLCHPLILSFHDLLASSGASPVPAASVSSDSLLVRLDNHRSNSSEILLVNGSQWIRSSVTIATILPYRMSFQVRGIGGVRVLSQEMETPQPRIKLDLELPVFVTPYGQSVPTGTMYVHGLQINITVDCEEGNKTRIISRVIALEAYVRLGAKAVPTDLAKAVESTNTIAGALSAVGGIAIPAGAMQQGVAMALLRMAQCNEQVLSGEEFDVLVHPLRFAVGTGPTAFARGAIIGNVFLIPLVWGLCSYQALPRLTSALTGRTLGRARDMSGWPSSALIPFSMLSEGTAIEFGSSVDIALGAFGLITLACTLGVWLHILKVRIPRQRLVLVRLMRSGMMWLADTRWEWALTKKRSKSSLSDQYSALVNVSVDAQGEGSQNTSDLVDASPVLSRYNHCYGEFWWLYSNFSGYALSILVGVAEGMPSNIEGLCRSRWVIASLGAVLQSVVVMTCTVPSQLILIGIIGLLTCGLVVLITISTFGPSVLSVDNDALNAVGVANAVVGILLMILGLCRLAYEAVRGRAMGGQEEVEMKSKRIGKKKSTADC